MDGYKQLLLCGFGVGLSWGTAIISMVDCSISEIVEY
jgi:3-oxoacyl-[acyl-carrier-protein] synthase-3